MNSVLKITAAILFSSSENSCHALSFAAPPSLTYHTCDETAALANQNSPFVNSRWSIQLNFGLEPGSFMPQRLPNWAASGARLGVPVELLFSPTRLDKCNIPENAEGRLGNNQIKEVQVSPTFQSTFVSERGEEAVSFQGGGYSMERSVIKTNETPKPRFLLRFWIDCITGAIRNDVELKPHTRIFGTIPIWDDPRQIRELEEELEFTNERMKLEDDDDSMDGSNKNPSFLDIFFKRRRRTDETSLSYRQEQIERLLPVKGCVKASNGVTIAPKGSLVMPYQDKYLIIGSFAMKPLSK